MTRALSLLRSVRGWLLVSLCAALASCVWLEGEFSSLDRLPPSCAAGALHPLPDLAERP